MSTEYKVALTHDEWKACHSLLENDDKLEYPTVLAVRDGKPIGMISTASGDEHLFVSHIVANSIFTCMKLYELYDQTMQNMGVDHYMFNIDKVNTKMVNAVERLFSIQPFSSTDKQLFYVRRI